LEKVLRYHPFCTEKIGCGVHYIKVDHHDSHSKSRCFFVVRTDGTVCDFSYHKCIKGKANAKNPSLALWYDHKYCLNHGQDEIFEHDKFDSPHIDPSHTLPSWTPSALHGGQLAEGAP
jgi:ribosomal protein L24E